MGTFSRALCLGVALALALGKQQTVVAVECPPEPSNSLGILVPFYVGYWEPEKFTQLAAYGSTCLVWAIISGDTKYGGPPDNALEQHREGFKLLHDSGIGLYGYVHTLADVRTSKLRPSADVLAEIDSWYTNYGDLLLGIFLDEVVSQASNGDAYSYYSVIADAIQAHGGRVMLNPGTQLTCKIAGLSDVYVRYENYAADWAADRKGVRCECSGVSSCGLLLHGQEAIGGAGSAATASMLASYENDAEGAGMSYIFVTNEAIPNPWVGLPSYWTQLLEAVKPGSSGDAAASSRPPPPPVSSPPPSPAPPPRGRKKPPPPPIATPSPSPSPSPSPGPPGTWWRPTGQLKWQIQLDGDDFRPMLLTRPSVIDVDVEMAAELLKQAQQVGVSPDSFKLVCYFSAGTNEPWREQFDAKRGVSWRALEAALGGGATPGPVYLKRMDPPWGDERWLSIDLPATRSALVDQVMQPRMAYAKQQGCHAVDPDNMDAYDNVPKRNGGRGVLLADQLAYNGLLVAAAHALGLSIGLKNALGLLSQVLPSGARVTDAYDWFLNEECFLYEECSEYTDNLGVRAAREGPPSVFSIEYCDGVRVFGSGAHNLRPECVCPLALATAAAGSNQPAVINTLIKSVDLIAVGLDCRVYCSTPGVVCTPPAGNRIRNCYKDSPSNICPLYGITATPVGRRLL